MLLTHDVYDWIGKKETRSRLIMKYYKVMMICICLDFTDYTTGHESTQTLRTRRFVHVISLTIEFPCGDTSVSFLCHVCL